MRKSLLLLIALFFSILATAQMSGTYTISVDVSQNPDYTSFSAAASALSTGIAGEVVFEVAPGTYEEYVTLNAINGTSTSNRVIFRGMGVDNQQVVITSNAGYTNNSTLTFDGTDYVTFENMTLASTSENTAIVVTLRGGLTDDRFENIRFVGCVSDASNTDNNKNLVYRLSGGWMDTNNAFVDCEFVNGFIGLYYQGVDLTQYNDGLLVENCTFTNQCSKSIYATFTDHVTLSGNTINNSNDTHTDYNAIDIFRCRYGCLVENNVMNVNHPNKYATVVKLRPCTGSITEPIIVRNNIVDFQGAASSWCYSFDNADSEYIYFAHNTGRCSGSGNSGNLFVQKDWEHFYAYNNLFVNETGGYVFRFNNASVNRFCDFNRISFMGSNVGVIAGTDCATLADWTALSGFDAHTDTCSPQFVGDNDLHLTSNEGLIVANPLSYVTSDIDGEDRTDTPCTGADEYVSGTNLPPVVANPINDIVFETYPASQTVDLTDTFNDPDDPNDNIIITVASNSNPALVGVMLNNRSLLVERQQNIGGSSVVILEATSNGQSVQTSFSVDCIIEDLPPVVSNPLEPVVFIDYPQSFSFDISGCFDDPDNNNEMMEYAVQSCPNEISASINDEDMLQVSRTTPNAFDGRTLVIRATSNGKYVDMEVSISGVEVVITVDVADFEDIELSPSGIWQPQEGNNEMFSHGWAFTNYYSPYFWGGFTASNRTDLSQTYTNAQYTAAIGCGYDGSAQYAVAYTYGAQTDVYSADGQPHAITGCYVTNNLWAYQNMLEGDNAVTPFGGYSGNDPDWFKLTATGKDANGQILSTLDFYLADYRFDNPEDDYILNTWEWFDLSPLGDVATISFDLSSSKTNSSGMITPAYFCMDDFNGGAASDQPPYVVFPIQDVVMNEFPKLVYINLDGVVTDPDNPDEDIVFSIVSNSNEAALFSTLNGRLLALNRLTEHQAYASVVLRATSNGQYVDFNVNVIMNEVEGIEESRKAVMVYPNPTDGMVTIDLTENQRFEYMVYDLLGRQLMSGQSQHGSAQIDLTSCHQGVYFVVLSWNSNRLMQKVVVR